MEGFRDPERARSITQKIRELAADIDESLLFMHVCGAHEWTVTHFGLRALLPDAIEVRAGPGCPVCITPSADIDAAVQLAEEGVVALSYGDMSRARGSRGLSVMDTRPTGGDVRLVYSVQDAVALAKREASKKFVFLAAGFDTTAPPTAYEVYKGVPDNLSFIVSYRYIPSLVGAVLRSSVLGVDGLINAGHSATVTGMKPYYPHFLETRKPQVFCGFEPIDVLLGILMLLRQIREKRPRLENEYARSVTWEGNVEAQRTMERVFDLEEGYVRGVATIPECGFRFKEQFAAHDAYEKYGLRKQAANEQFVHGARCGEVILGLADPPECPLYMKGCTHQTPKGPPMVSAEGTCRIWSEHKITEPLKCRIG